MKKTIIGIIVVIAMASGIWLLPSERSYHFQSTVQVPLPAVLRLMTDSSQASRWWPGGQEQDGTLDWEQGTYRITEAYFSKVNLSGLRNGIGSNISLEAVSSSTTATILTMSVSSHTTGSALWKPLQYWSMHRQQQEHQRLMDTLTRFFSHPDLVYGFPIKHDKVKDGTLLSFRKSFDHEPATEEIYAMVDTVRRRIALAGARETSLPMLNIYKSETGETEAMTAIATDREVEGTGPFSLKRMLPNGNILVAEVKGGPHAIRQCMEAVDAYVKDRRILSPAMPFQRMITDRRAEPDTNQWVTTINYPIF